MMAARARVLVDTRSEALQTLSTPQLPKQATRLQTVTAWYMAGLARQRAGQAEAATQALATARRIVANLNRAKHVAMPTRTPVAPLYDPAEIYGIVPSDVRKPSATSPRATSVPTGTPGGACTMRL